MRRDKLLELLLELRFKLRVAKNSHLPTDNIDYSLRIILNISVGVCTHVHTQTQVTITPVII